MTLAVPVFSSILASFRSLFLFYVPQLYCFGLWFVPRLLLSTCPWARHWTWHLTFTMWIMNPQQQTAAVRKMVHSFFFFFKLWIFGLMEAMKSWDIGHSWLMSTPALIPVYNQIFTALKTQVIDNDRVVQSQVTTHRTIMHIWHFVDIHYTQFPQVAV